jgi:hypothetical protein
LERQPISAKSTTALIRMSRSLSGKIRISCLELKGLLVSKLGSLQLLAHAFLPCFKSVPLNTSSPLCSKLGLVNIASRRQSPYSNEFCRKCLKTTPSMMTTRKFFLIYNDSTSSTSTRPKGNFSTTARNHRLPIPKKVMMKIYT